MSARDRHRTPARFSSIGQGLNAASPTLAPAIAHSAVAPTGPRDTFPRRSSVAYFPMTDGVKLPDPYIHDPDLSDFVPIGLSDARGLVRRGYEDCLEEMGLSGDGSSVRMIARTDGGRSAHPIVALASGERILVRRYRRGGAIRYLNRETYFGGHRALEELRVTVAAARRGVRVPHVVAAIERPRRFGYTASIALSWIDGALELVQLLELISPDARVPVLRAAGAEIGRMHETGIAHPDLNLRNLLVAGPEDGSDGMRVFVIDFDRAKLSSGPVGRARRIRDLRRLARSAWRFASPIDATGWTAFREGYGPAWPLTTPLG